MKQAEKPYRLAASAKASDNAKAFIAKGGAEFIIHAKTARAALNCAARWSGCPVTDFIVIGS